MVGHSLVALGVALAVGVGWGVFPWPFASGIVMPGWLAVVSIPAMVPSVTATALAPHLVWG